MVITYNNSDEVAKVKHILSRRQAVRRKYFVRPKF